MGSFWGFSRSVTAPLLRCAYRGLESWSGCMATWGDCFLPFDPANSAHNEHELTPKQVLRGNRLFDWGALQQGAWHAFFFSQRPTIVQRLHAVLRPSLAGWCSRTLVHGKHRPSTRPYALAVLHNGQLRSSLLSLHCLAGGVPGFAGEMATKAPLNLAPFPLFFRGDERYRFTGAAHAASAADPVGEH